MNTQQQVYGVYLVTGRRQYRGHDPGTTFEALLDTAAEQRAVARRDIRLLRRIKPTVPDGYRLGDWPPPDRAPQPATNEGAQEAPFSLKEGV